MKKAKMKYKCLCCGVLQTIETTKETYKEVYVCQECNGALVDTWAVGKYINNKPQINRIDDDSVKHLANEIAKVLRNFNFQIK